MKNTADKKKFIVKSNYDCCDKGTDEIEAKTLRGAMQKAVRLHPNWKDMDIYDEDGWLIAERRYFGRVGIWEREEVIWHKHTPGFYR